MMPQGASPAVDLDLRRAIVALVSAEPDESFAAFRMAGRLGVPYDDELRDLLELMADDGALVRLDARVYGSPFGLDVSGVELDPLPPDAVEAPAVAPVEIGAAEDAAPPPDNVIDLDSRRPEPTKRKRDRPRAVTFANRNAPPRAARPERASLVVIDEPRPATRADCAGGHRPCPFIACKFHLYLDVSTETGNIKLNFPEIGPDELERMPETCALDVAESEGTTLERVGEFMNLTRERLRQIEVSALLQIKMLGEIDGSTDLWRRRMTAEFDRQRAEPSPMGGEG